MRYITSQIARAGELARIEEQLRQECNTPVKVAFDPLGRNEVLARYGVGARS